VISGLSGFYVRDVGAGARTRQRPVPTGEDVDGQRTRVFMPHSTLFWLNLLQGLHSDALAAYSSALDSLEKAAGNAASAASTAAAAAADCQRCGFVYLMHAFFILLSFRRGRRSGGAMMLILLTMTAANLGVTVLQLGSNSAFLFLNLEKLSPPPPPPTAQPSHSPPPLPRAVLSGGGALHARHRHLPRQAKGNALLKI
jgi:hypothetical protein